MHIKKEKRIKKQTEPHANHAERFMKLKQTLDNIKEHYNNKMRTPWLLSDDLVDNIDVNSFMAQCIADATKKKGTDCMVSNLKDLRRCVPTDLLDAIDWMKKEDKSLVSWHAGERVRSLEQMRSGVWYQC